MKAFILAGGFATRLWPLTENRAKPMLLVDGQPILGHILEKIPLETEVYLLTNSRFEPDFKEFLKNKKRSVQIFCEDAHCDTDKLGALAAVSAAIDYFKVEEDILVVAGDNLLPELDMNLLRPSVDEAHLALKQVEDLHTARSFGVVELENEKQAGLGPVKSFAEKPESPASRFVSTGFMGIGKNLLPLLQRFAENSPDALGAIITEFLAQKKQVKAFLVPGEWFDVGSYEAYLAAHKSLQTKNQKIEASAILKNTTCEGKVYVGEGAVVENSVLIDAVIYPNTKLNNCHITQSVVDENCDFSGVDLSRKLVRQGTILHADES